MAAESGEDGGLGATRGRDGSLLARALAAVALMIGFYLLALSITGVLLYIPYAEWTHLGRIHLKLGAGCLIGAGMILWSILPRFDRFLPPGPSLSPQDHPRLRDTLEHIARATGQELPREVYLVPEMNAWVANRGGVMGFGSRRVMGLGLPLMQVVSVPEFSAILAHEFGHYHGGDTRLGPWIYKTRSAIGRTLENLGAEGWLHLPFRWYGLFFLRVTQAISRAQEYTADRLAAAVAGARALIDGLKKVHAYAPAYDAYWEQELLPVLNAGYRVPMAQGFDQFVGVPRVRDAVQAGLEEQLAGAEPDPYESHPPLNQRIAAVEGAAAADPAEADGPAVHLLGNIPAAEQALIDHFSAQAGGVEFRPLSWADVPDRVFLPGWQQQAGALSEPLAGVCFGELQELLRSRSLELARFVVGQPDPEIPSEVLPGLLAQPIGAALVAGLVREGFALSAGLGEAVRLERDGITLEPFSLVGPLVKGDATASAAWTDILNRTGIASRPICA